MNEPTPHPLHEANRLSWNAVTPAHNSHKDDQAAFFRAGGSTLFPEEMSLLGEITGQSLVHLQCNAGQDSLSLARLGARVTGVDISDEAIAFARKLSAETGIPATFCRADVYHWLDAATETDERFDIAFCSYGSICWLSDVKRWAAGLAAILGPGGRFVAVDFHPAAMIFDENRKLAYPYSSAGRPQKWDEGIQDYVAAAGTGLVLGEYHEGVRDFKNPHPVYEFAWGLGDIITALLAAGLQLEQFHEYPYSNGAKLFNDMRETEGRRMTPPPQVPDLPLMFGLAARRP